MSTQFREDDIRPDRLKHDQAACIESDIRWLESRRGDFVEAACPACGADDAREAFRKRPHVYGVCQQCGTLYVSPRPPAKLLGAFYAQSKNYEYWNRFIFPASEAVRRERIFRPRAARVVEACRRHRPSPRVLLEVGGGFGMFCEEIRTLGLFERIVAVEPTPDLAETCRRKGFEVIEKPIEEVTISGGSVDVIAAFEVIEHLFSPGDFLAKCAGILAPGGLLVLTCPNARGFDVEVLGPHSESVDHEHLNYFHPASLSRLVASLGLVTLEVATPGRLDAELVRKKALAGAIDLETQPFLKHVLIDEWERLGDSFQEFLAGNGLSTHMWLVARKGGA